MRIDYTRVAPEAAKALAGLHHQVLGSGLGEALIELVYLRVSQLNGCAHCLDRHSRALRRLGASAEKLALLPAWREGGSLFDARERAALAWSEAIDAAGETGVPDAEFAAVSAVFGAKEVVDLTIAAALMGVYNRLGIGLRIPPRGAA